MPFPSKLKSHCVKVGFKKGEASPVKGKTFGFVREKCANKYVRLDRETHESRVHDSDNGVLTFHDVDGTETRVRPLRPRFRVVSYVDALADSTPLASRVHPDLKTNKIYVPELLQRMMATENRSHRVKNASCRGDLVIDGFASQKWGGGWSECLMCTRCKYRSKMYKMYHEVERKGRGRKAAQVNVGLVLGSQSTSVGNTGIQTILNNANIIAPARSGMQKVANKVATKLKQINQESMTDIRRSIVTTNETIGQKNPRSVNVEVDSMYNNRMFNADSTPFQAGTQVATTMVENNTKHKKVIGFNFESKLCPTATRLRNKGHQVSCPKHKGHCSATLKPDDTIGDEQKYSNQVAKQVSRELSISNVTCDGDSKAYDGVKASQKHNVGHFKDLRHLGNSLKRAVAKAPFSKTMLPNNPKINLRNRFALSVKSRCIAELKTAHKHHSGDLKCIKRVMPQVKKSIIQCFKGYCGNQCKMHSYVCNGDKSFTKNFLPGNLLTRVKMNAEDEIILDMCLDMILSPTSLELTKHLSTTQKCEAVNRALVAVVPKSVTFTRNAEGRMHGRIHALNHGTGTSVLLKTDKLGAPITRGSTVIRQLAARDRTALLQKDPIRKMKACTSRAKSRSFRYALHEKLHYRRGMSDPKPDFSQIPHLRHHTYA